MSIKKMEEKFQELLKLDPELATALRETRKFSPKSADVFARKLFTDFMIPKSGNMLAYNDFLQRHKNDGIHVHTDLADFGQINKFHSEMIGDKAIKDFGNMAADLSRKHGLKIFRKHGDEISAWAPDEQRAHAFVRELREQSEKLPKVGSFDPQKHPKYGLTPDYNGHNISPTIGIGYSPEHAEKALIMAKDKLGPKDQFGHRKNFHKIGEAPVSIHSLLHESPPEGWKPGKGKPETQPIGIKEVSPLKNVNPLK